MIERKDWEAQPPWEAKDCSCEHPSLMCALCDGEGWFFHNSETGQTVSPLLADAFDRHG